MYTSVQSITGLQCREARALLRWNVRDLSFKANVDTSRIIRFEAAKDKLLAEEMNQIIEAFVREKLEFLIPGGVRFTTEKRDIRSREEKMRQHRKVEEALHHLLDSGAI